MDIYNQIGKIALGSRLRRLSEHIVEEAFQVYKLYDRLQLKKSQKFPTTSVEFFESDKITFKRFSAA
jgi:hypothetical protein